MRNCLGEQSGGVPPLDQARAEFTRNYLRQVLDLSAGNVSRAARLAGRNRTDLYKLFSRHNIDTKTHKTRRHSESL